MSRNMLNKNLRPAPGLHPQRYLLIYTRPTLRSNAFTAYT